jgi:hypothetical protein
MKFLEKLTKKINIFQRIVGLTNEQFNILVEKVAPNWENAEEERKLQSIRKRKIGAGHPYKFEELREKLLIVLLYFKLYLTQEFLGMIVDLDQANISRLLKKMLPLIEKSADPEMAIYLKKIKDDHVLAEKTNNWEAFVV